MPEWKVFRHAEKGKALQNSDGTDAHGSGQKHRVPVHYDLLQPYSNLYRQSRRASACYVSSVREESGCLIIKFWVFILCTVLDFQIPFTTLKLKYPIGTDLRYRKHNFQAL